MENKNLIEAYYKDFNASNSGEVLSAYYSDDVIFEYQDDKVIGKTAVISYLDGAWQAVKETLTPLNIVVDGDKAAVEVDDRIEAKIDLPEFLGRSFKAGESINAKFSLFYDIRDGKICHIRIYSF
ncbi:MAG: nuclear transport factor 2 family protein [Deltaproteobacteria bacterium]|nr:nuclear transport factor 2 family protein [Deltaproteobacteria bacterium]